MAIRPEFVIERQGKKAVLYAGLLALAHEEGLISITTEVIQLPSDANGNTAVSQARVVLERDGRERTFMGVGDANATNVPRHIGGHIIRMAETRAKARALRDAVNIGDVALEELDDDADAQPARATGNGHSRQPVPSPDGRDALLKRFKDTREQAAKVGFEIPTLNRAQVEAMTDAKIETEIKAMKDMIATVTVPASE